MSNKWEMVRLGDAFVLQMGKTPDRQNQNYWNNASNKWISIADITKDKYICNTKESISDIAVCESGIKAIPPNTVIMSFKLSIGKVCITKDKVYSNEAIMAFLPNNPNNIDISFLYYRLLSHNWTLGINKAVKGITLNKVSLNNTRILFPTSILHQRKIAQILDKASELIEKRKKQLHELDRLAESVFYDMFGDPVTNSKGWIICKVIEQTTCIVPGRDKPKSFTGNIPWITTADLNHLGYTYKANLFLSQTEISEVKAKIIPSGSVIMTCVGDLGIVSITGNKMIINQQLHAFICNDKINNIFLAYNLSYRKDYMYKMASNTTVPYMNKMTCNSIPIMLPPLDLQHQFASIIEKIEAQKAKVKAALKDSKDLFQRLMQDMFNPEYHEK